MRCLALALLVTMVAAPAFAANILIYDSYAGTYCGGSQAARVAASMCGHTYTAYASGSEAQWISDLSTGNWDIVVFDVCSNYAGDAPSQSQMRLYSTQLDALYQWHLSHADGCGVIALWFMSYDPSPIFTYYGVSPSYDFSSTVPLYSWNTSDPVWAGLPNPLQNQEFCWGTDGTAVNVLTGAEALGGFTAASAPGQAGLVANNARHTWYIGETGNGGTYDGDGDGKLDWSELYCNIFDQCGAGPTATTPSTWSAVKSLYR